MRDLDFVADFFGGVMKEGLMVGVLGGVIAGSVVCGIPGYYLGKKKGVETMQQQVIELRLSERKACEFPYDHQREEIFVHLVIPALGLRRGTHEYNALERACVSGVFGTDEKDFAISTKDVKMTYKLCGWSVRK